MPKPPAIIADVPNYNSASGLRSFLDERGLSVRKQWGQNFLINPGARKTIIDALDAEEGATVWEIGSGLGCMTGELLKKGLTLTAFEIDPGFCSILENFFASYSGFTLIRGDVLKTWKTAEKASYLLGNLPYTIAAVLMGNLIENGCFFSRMVITVQKEVALRMAAAPCSKNYSSISVLCASAYAMKIIMTLKGQSFYPVPRVDSAVICFERLANATPLSDTAPVPALFYPLVRSLFASRRKIIANNLLNFIARSCTIKEAGIAAADVTVLTLKTCGLLGNERAEQLSHKVFLAIACALENYVVKGNI